MQLLGSLVGDESSSLWASFRGESGAGGNEALIRSVLETMDEGESCGF